MNQQAESIKATTASEGSFLEAAKEAQPGLISDFWSFLKENKKWWLIPFLVVFGLVGVVVVLTLVAPGAVPFIYALW